MLIFPLSQTPRSTKGILPMPVTEKRLGADVIILAAKTVSRNPTSWASDSIKERMLRDLQFQCAVRIHDDFGERTMEVVEEVAQAACLLGPSWKCGDPVLDFLTTQVKDPIVLSGVLSRVGLGKRWVIYSCPNSGRTEFAIEEIYDEIREETAELRRRLPLIRRALASIPRLSGVTLEQIREPRATMLAIADPVSTDDAPCGGAKECGCGGTPVEDDQPTAA